MFATPCWLSQWLVVETAGTASALSWSVLVGDLPLASGALTILFSHDLGCGGIYKMVVMLRSCWPGAHIFLVFIQITIALAQGPSGMVVHRLDTHCVAPGCLLALPQTSSAPFTSRGLGS